MGLQSGMRMRQDFFKKMRYINEFRSEKRFTPGWANEKVEYMRNRSNYNYTPAASSKTLQKKPAPRRPQRNWNQVLMGLFFFLLPLLALLSLFFEAMKWVFIVATLLTILFMWVEHGFVLRGRLIMSGLYGILTVAMLTSVLSGAGVPTNTRPIGTIAPISAPQVTSGINADVAGLLQGQMGGGLTATQDVGAYGGQAVLSTGEGVDALAKDNMDSALLSGQAQGTSAAEIALDQFLRCWQLGVMEDLVQYTSPSWQELNAPPKQKLFYKFYTKTLQSWVIEGIPSGSDTDDSRTVTVVVNILYNGREERTLSCDALLVKEGGSWYVDPDSLSTGTTVEVTTPEPGEVEETPPPFETPAPTAPPTGKTVLYYNSKGGSYYHIEAECPTVDVKYLPLTSFTYGKLTESNFANLKPCARCNAPERPTSEE